MTNPSREQVLAAYRAAPVIVREASMSEETSSFSDVLRKKYQLHIDVTGALAVYLGYLIIGLMTPNELLSELSRNGVPKDQGDQILKDINEKIFVPLRERMRAGVMKSAQENDGKLVANSPPRMPQGKMAAGNAPRVVPPPPSYAAPVPKPQAPRAIEFSQTPRPPMPQMASMTAPAPKPLVPQTPPAPRPSNVAPLPPKMAMPKVFMPGSNARPVRPMLPVGEEEPAAFRVHKTAPPPVNLPGAQMPPAPPPPPAQPRPLAPHEAPPISLTPKPSAPPATPAKPYTVDPYREPVE